MSTGAEPQSKAGLKKELGLGEPKSAGSTEQATDFKAQFQAIIKQVNQHLQFTAAHAEPSKHSEEASRRENSCTAYQAVVKKIDPNDPSAAQAAIDKILDAVKGIESSAKSLKETVEKAFNAWTDQEPEVDDWSDKVREMVEWGHEKASALQKVIGNVVNKAGEKKYEEAVSGFEAMKAKAAQIYEDFLKQKEAQPKYEEGLQEIKSKLAEIGNELPKQMEEKKKEIDASVKELQTKAESKDFVSACEALSALLTKIVEFVKEVAEKVKVRVEYMQAREAALAKYEQCHFLAHSYKELKADQQQLKPKLDAVDAAAAEENFEQAKKLADELKTACEAYLEKCKEQQKKYDEKGAEITKELDGADDLKRQEVARKIAGELKPDVIKHMPVEVRNRLMQEMQKDGFSEADKRAMDNLYKTRTLDPEFEEAERVKREALIKKLKSDPEFAKAREKWDDMDKKERLKIIEKAANIHADVYGTKDIEPKLKVVEKYKEVKKDEDGNVTGWNNGVYNHRTGEIGINTNPYGEVDEDGDYQGVKFNNFDLSIDLAVHESGHRYQSALVERVKSGDLKKGDPEYNQAVAFSINDPLAIAHEGEEDRYDQTYYAREGSAYYNQPMEAHSRESAGEVQESGIGHGHDHDHDHDHEHEH